MSKENFNIRFALYTVFHKVRHSDNVVVGHSIKLYSVLRGNIGHKSLFSYVFKTKTTLLHVLIIRTKITYD